jgi:hypothetical protein
MALGVESMWANTVPNWAVSRGRRAAFFVSRLTGVFAPEPPAPVLFCFKRRSRTNTSLTATLTGAAIAE